MVITAICGKHRWRGIEHCATTQFPTAEAIISFRIIDTKRGDVIKRATTRDPRFENRSRILPHGLKQRFIWIYQEESNDNYINENKYFLFWIFIFKKNVWWRTTKSMSLRIKDSKKFSWNDCFFQKFDTRNTLRLILMWKWLTHR